MATLLILSFLLHAFIPTSGKEIFVSSKGGADTILCGTRNYPCRTISNAVFLVNEGDILTIDSGEHYVYSPITIYHSITIQGDDYFFEGKPTIYFEERLIGVTGSPYANIFTCYGNISISLIKFVFRETRLSIFWQPWDKLTWFYLIEAQNVSVKYCSFSTSNPLTYRIYNWLHKNIVVGTVSPNITLDVYYSTFSFHYQGNYQTSYINIMGYMQIFISDTRYVINNAHVDYGGSIEGTLNLLITNSYFSGFHLDGIGYSVSIINSTFVDSTMTNNLNNMTFVISQCTMDNTYMYFKNVVEGTVTDTTFKNLPSKMTSPAIRLVLEYSRNRSSVSIIRCIFKNISLSRDLVPIISIQGNSFHTYPNTRILNKRFYLINSEVMDLSDEVTIVNIEGINDTIKGLSIHCDIGHFINFFTNQNYKHEQTYKVLLNCLSCKKDYYNLYGEHNTIDKQDNGNLSFKNALYNKQNCFLCPLNGKCENGKIRSKGAYWGYNETLNSIKFLPCPTYYCCPTLKQCLSYNTCASNRKGRLCSDCLPSFSCSLSRDYRCVPNKMCNNQTKGFIALSILSTFFVIILLFQKEIMLIIKKLIKTKETRQPPTEQCESVNQNLSDFEERLIHIPSDISDYPVYYQELTSTIANVEYDQYRRIPTISSGSVKILFFFYQAASIIRIQSAEKLNISFPRFFDFISTFFSIRIDVSYSKMPLCMMPNLSVIHTEILKLSIIFISLSALFLIWIVTYIYCSVKKDNTTLLPKISTVINEDVPSYCKLPMLTRVKCTYLQFLLISFAGIATFSFKAVYCVTINQNSYLYQQASIKCFQPWQYIIMFWISAWIIPFPVVLWISSKFLHKCQITPNQFLAVMTFPPVIIPYLVSVKLNPHGTLNKKDAMDAKHLLLVVNEPFRESGKTEDGYRMCWEVMLIIRRMLLIVMNTFILSPITKLYPMAILLLLYTFQHVMVAPFADHILNKLEFLSLIILVSFVFMNNFWAMTQEYDLLTNPSYVVLGKVLLFYEMVILSLPVLLGLLCILGYVIKSLYNTVSVFFGKKRKVL